ncbi:MAG: hypothetical protein ACLQGT_07100 [Terracidiphilus sp.]
MTPVTHGAGQQRGCAQYGARISDTMRASRDIENAMPYAAFVRDLRGQVS